MSVTKKYITVKVRNKRREHHKHSNSKTIHIALLKYKILLSDSYKTKCKEKKQSRQCNNSNLKWTYGEIYMHIDLYKL